MKVVMHPKEVDLITSFMSAATNYFEFGSGGSTHLAASLVRGDIRSVESDKNWASKVQESLADNPKVDVRFIDIGPTIGWGTPQSDESADQFLSYSQAIVDTGRDDFDLCLVDGRFRVACFLQSLKHLQYGAIIAIHDYAVRPNYHLVEKYARPIATMHELWTFVRRPDCDMTALERDLEAHRLDWA